MDELMIRTTDKVLTTAHRAALVASWSTDLSQYASSHGRKAHYNAPPPK